MLSDYPCKIFTGKKMQKTVQFFIGLHLFVVLLTHDTSGKVLAAFVLRSFNLDF